MKLRLAGMFCLLSAMLVAGDFSIKHPNGYVNKSLKSYWDDHVVDAGGGARVPYPGLVLHTQGESNIQMTLFILGYKGVGRYKLDGTRDIYDVAARASNAFYSNMGLLVVDPSRNADCWVEITEDKDGRISGNYRVEVAYPIGKEPRMSLSGQFSQVEKFKE